MSGTAFGGGGVLDLGADGAKTGKITLSNGQFEHFATIDVAAKSIWDFAGTFTAGSTLAILNNGSIIEAKADLATFDGAKIGSGMILISKPELTLNGRVGSGQKIVFSGTGETLALGDANTFAGSIERFATGETIDLTGIAPGMIVGTKFSTEFSHLRNHPVRLP